MGGKTALTLTIALIGGLVAAGVAYGAPHGAPVGAAIGGPLDALPVAILALCAAAVLLLVAVRTDPAWILTAGVLLTIFSGNWGHLGLPPVDRLLIALGLLALLVTTARSAERPTIRAAGIHILLVVVAVYALLSALWAGSFSDSAALFALLDRLGFIPFAMFAVAPIAYRTARQRAILLGGLVGLGGYLGLTALFETVGFDAGVFPRYILNPDVGIHVERARGPFVEAAANGLALFVCAVAALIAYATWKNRNHRWVAAAVAVLCLMGTVFTLTRAIWLSAVVAGVLTLLAHRQLRRYTLPAVGVGALAVLAALALVPSLSGDAQSRTADQRPVWDRLNMMTAGQNMVEERPLFGFGWYRAHIEIPDYFEQNEDFPVTGSGLEIHNVYLSNAVELGLVGVTLWLAALLIAVGGAALRRGPPELRLWRIGMLAIAAQWLIVANFVPLFFPFATLILWLWAGVLSRQYVDDRAFLLGVDRDYLDAVPDPEPLSPVGQV